MPQANPTQIQSFLKGINYPTGKAELIKNAKRMGADETVCASLDQLPEREFRTPADVNQALSGIQQGASGQGGYSEFLSNAIQDSLAEIRLCELALQKASNEDVKQLAQQIIDDHTYMEIDMERLAASKNIPVPTDLTPKDRSTIQQLSQLSGQEFDMQFMSHSMSDHEKDFRIFRHYADQEEDEEIREMAKNAAGVVSQHMKIAREVAGKLRS